MGCSQVGQYHGAKEHFLALVLISVNAEIALIIRQKKGWTGIAQVCLRFDPSLAMGTARNSLGLGVLLE